MASLLIRVSAEVADQFFPELPIVRRQEYDEVYAFAFDQADGGGYVAAPLAALTTIQALILQPDQAITVRLNIQTDTGTPIEAGGFLVIFGTSINNSSNTGVRIDNASGETVTVRGVALGT